MTNHRNLSTNKYLKPTLDIRALMATETCIILTKRLRMRLCQKKSASQSKWFEQTKREIRSSKLSLDIGDAQAQSIYQLCVDSSFNAQIVCKTVKYWFWLCRMRIRNWQTHTERMCECVCDFSPPI